VARLQERQHAQRQEQEDAETESGEVTIEVPRDRQGTFEPQIIEKHQTRFEGFDTKIISMYTLGMPCGIFKAICTRCMAWTSAPRRSPK